MANPIDDPLFDPTDAAEYLPSTTGTMQWWRHVGRGPAYIKLGHKVYYRRSALDAFRAAGERQPEVTKPPAPARANCRSPRTRRRPRQPQDA